MATKIKHVIDLQGDANIDVSVGRHLGTIIIETDCEIIELRGVHYKLKKKLVDELEADGDYRYVPQSDY